MESELNRKHGKPGISFRAVELTVRVTQYYQAMNRYNHVLLVSNDPETLHYAEQNLPRMCRLAAIVGNPAEDLKNSVRHDSLAFSRELESLLDSLVRNSDNNLLEHMTSSMKTAILSLACDRYKSDRRLICSALGLTEEQLDQELRRYGMNSGDDLELQQK